MGLGFRLYDNAEASKVFPIQSQSFSTGIRHDTLTLLDHWEKGEELLSLNFQKHTKLVGSFPRPWGAPVRHHQTL